MIIKELDKHYNKYYKNSFNKNEFLNQYYFKKDTFNELGIYYGYYVVPDKSIVCKKFLPFHTEIEKRNVDKVNEINDFKDFLNPSDYFKYDSHMNYDGGRKLSYKILNDIYAI